MVSNDAIQIPRERIERALRFIAEIAARPGGVVYLPIFERLERELAACDASMDALARARAMIEARPRSSPATPRGV
ncbi:MAG: hypothetical protein ACKVP7_15130 [Hyphomicrobiaceae bacterium]